ncbi:MAG: bifunctional oligoribonuclease/PAP phosphatase NrnA [Candidatus Pelethousia sp.]|nr:bifunctional oligoribonuclease/PAP phosphatase NrnA [Candidatus Pelethousia sp.]
MLQQREIDDLCAFIKARDGFTIIAHMSPDGDALGSSLALLWLLRKLNKRVEVVCADPVPGIYAFLPLAGEVLLPSKATGYKNVIAVDCADKARLGKAGDLFEAAEATYNIDHHPTNDAYARHNAVDPSAAATGELIYRLAQSLGVRIEADFASCLYAALMTDTGNFAYSNTTGETLRIAGDLLDAGADGYALNLRIYRSTSLERLKLLQLAIANIRLYREGAVGITSLSRAEIGESGAHDEETEGVVDCVRDIESVEIAVFIKENGASGWKISLRSKLRADVGAIAAQMGGGGHERAAGYSARGELAAVWADALRRAEEALA